MAETTRLARTIETWWPHILVFLELGVTNARTEGFNRIIKQVKRTGCGFRNIVLSAAHHEPHRRHQSGMNTSWRDHPRQVRRGAPRMRRTG